MLGAGQNTKCLRTKRVNEQYPFKPAVVHVSLPGRAPTFEFSSDEGQVCFTQFALWREGMEQPLWSIVADSPAGVTRRWAMSCTRRHQIPECDPEHTGGAMGPKGAK